MKLDVQQESFPHREERMLEIWRRHRVFERSLEERVGAPSFVFYDGPPFATGLPHYGHLLAGTIKDVVPRYKTMKGYYVPRRFGWDCHGLPVENEIEKAQELSGAHAIEHFGIAKFNEACRSIVLRYTEEWKKTVVRMGRWVDFTYTYRTMDTSFMESVWWVFGQLYGRGLVYEGFKVMPFSARLGTPLSNFEANLNYKDVEDPSLTVTFPLLEQKDTYLLAWTTTPWTLPSNLAVAVGKDVAYVKIQDLKTNRFYILASSRLDTYFKDKEAYEVIETFDGDALARQTYQPLFPYFAHRKEHNAFRVLVDDFVSTEDGTGIVHMAPAFGEVDFFACAKAGIELVCPVDQNGKFTHEVPDYEGLFVKDADKDIIKRLKEEKRVFHHGQIRHRYPFCWRSDTPLIYKAVCTWFVAVEKLKDRLLAANEQIHWMPENIKVGRFGKWLENARDWAISRNRYWGTPIPIWRSASGKIIVISSIEELEKRTGKKIEDLHRHFIDGLTFTEEGETFHRISEVFDCWFESGSMPYAQNHFPFENKEETLKGFPADFIAEGLDQTRGWFYTLTVLAVALFDQPAFKNVVVNGILLAEDGMKMSKRLKNYPEPEVVIDRYGADAMRLYLLGSPAVQAEDLRFSERGVELVMRQVLIPFWNSYVFFATYARIYKWTPIKHEVQGSPQAEIDRWMLSLLQKLIDDVTGSMDTYKLAQAVQPLTEFVEQLTNWYIRRSRPRFWAEEDTQDRREAFSTLYTVLLGLSKIAAPFIPFLSDAIYQELRQEKDPLSVHLCDYPVYEPKRREFALEQEMGYVLAVVGCGHALRKEHKLKVRQPLSTAHLICSDAEVLRALENHHHLIADELNVKEVVSEQEESGFVSLIAKPNFRVLGKKVGKLMQGAQKRIGLLAQKELALLMNGNSFEIEVEGEKILLTPEDVAVERKVKEGIVALSSGNITVALDTALTEELLIEGLAREIINKINTMRRDDGYQVTDRIAITLQTTEKVKACFELYYDLICHEVLATSVSFAPCEGTAWDLNGEPTVILLAKS